MLVQKVVGNTFEEGLSLHNDDLFGFEIVALTWDECAKRLHRKVTEAGREIGISLPLNSSLRHGDILYRDDDSMIVVFVQPCDVLVVQPDSIRDLGRVAYEFGNRHLPLEVTDRGEIVLLPDGPTELLLDKLSVRYEKVRRRFHPIPKGGSHRHDHHHGHSHDHSHSHDH